MSREDTKQKKCYIELRTWYPEEMAIQIPLTIDCKSPTSPDCKVDDELAKHVIKIEAYEWEDYHYKKYHLDRTYKKWVEDHVLISTRWIQYCGMLTRAYIRRDGALVLTHDEVYYDGVHVIYFNKPIWELLGLNGFEEIKKVADEFHEERLKRWKNEPFSG